MPEAVELKKSWRGLLDPVPDLDEAALEARQLGFDEIVPRHQRVDTRDKRVEEIAIQLNRVLRMLQVRLKDLDRLGQLHDGERPGPSG